MPSKLARMVTLGYPPDLFPDELADLLASHTLPGGLEHVRLAVELALQMAYLRGGMDAIRRMDAATPGPADGR